VKLSYRALFCGTSALALASLCGTALAQDNASGDDEIVVTGIRASMRDSLIMKRNTTLVSDAISTEDIGQLPDVTIAEELNRLPGINTTRDRGNASQASVRGMGPRLVFGLLNGRDVASSEPSQAVRWEIFPSEVLGGVQVYKSQDATLIPGGVAATIDIRTIRPLDHDGNTFTVRAGPTYHDAGASLPHYDPWGYRGSAGYIGHINENVAVALAASVQRSQNGYPDFRTFGWNTPDNSGGNTGDVDGDGTPDNTTWGLASEVKEIQQDRASVLGAIGWRVTPNFTINADLLYSEYEIQEDQFQLWYGNNHTGNWAGGDNWIYNAPGNSYDIVNGTVVAANLNAQNVPGDFKPWFNYQSQIARYDEFHNLWAGGVNFAWSKDDWDASLDVSHSEAWRENRWQAIYLGDQFFPELEFDVRDGIEPYATIGGYDPYNPAYQFTDDGRNGQSDGPWETSDELSAIALDVDRSLEGGPFTGIEFGLRYSDREKSVRRSQFQYCSGVGSILNGASCSAAGGADVSLASAGLETFSLDDFFVHPPMAWGDFDRLLPLVYPNTSVPAGSELPLSHSDVGETLTEGYGKVNFAGDIGGADWQGSFGVRLTNVSIESSGFQTTDGGATFDPVTITNDYTEILPSLNLVFNLTDDQLLRFGLGKAIARPPLDALVTAFNLNPIGIPPSGGGGNPLLEPYRATQVDLSYEWYFHEESLLAAAFFYKDLESIIGASQSLQVIDGVQYIIGGENNGGGGHITGVELTFQTRFFFLGGVLEDFGVYANYAIADSDVKEFSPASNPYPMVGLTDNTGVLDFFYSKGGFETRLSFKHHGEFTFAPGWNGANLILQSPEDTLDGSISYEIGHWSMRLNGRNLTDEPSRRSTDNNVQNLANNGGYQYFGRTFLFDVAFKY
jgi:iron complex outermembrane recepter protein